MDEPELPRMFLLRLHREAAIDNWKLARFDEDQFRALAVVDL